MIDVPQCVLIEVKCSDLFSDEAKHPESASSVAQKQILTSWEFVYYQYFWYTKVFHFL